MSKAGTVLRRSGVLLKSLGSANSSLQLLIGQLKDMRFDLISYFPHNFLLPGNFFYTSVVVAVVVVVVVVVAVVVSPTSL